MTAWKYSSVLSFITTRSQRWGRQSPGNTFALTCYHFDVSEPLCAHVLSGSTRMSKRLYENLSLCAGCFGSVCVLCLWCVASANAGEHFGRTKAVSAWFKMPLHTANDLSEGTMHSVSPPQETVFVRKDSRCKSCWQHKRDGATTNRNHWSCAKRERPVYQFPLCWYHKEEFDFSQSALLHCVVEQEALLCIFKKQYVILRIHGSWWGGGYDNIMPNDIIGCHFKVKNPFISCHAKVQFENTAFQEMCWVRGWKIEKLLSISFIVQIHQVAVFFNS